MKKVITVLVLAIFVLSIPAVAFSADMPSQKGVSAVSAKSTSSKMATYPAGPIQKAERGFMNAAFGWTEIPKRIVDKTKESNPIKGLLLGTWQGTCKAFARTASGVSELATFPIGRYDKPRVLPDMPAAK